jgi:hypothetical protein
MGNSQQDQEEIKYSLRAKPSKAAQGLLFLCF